MKINSSLLQEIQDDIEILMNFLIENSFENSVLYRNWKEEFIPIYDESTTNLELFLLFSLVYFTGWRIYFQIINGNEYYDKNYEELTTMADQITRNDAFSLIFFNDLIKLFNNKERVIYEQVLTKIAPKAQIPLENYLDDLIKKLISSNIRHKSGEFYTPPFLVKMMIDESYYFGEKVIDPSCGSGNFLSEIIKKIIKSNKNQSEKKKAINNIYGFDINPVSLLLARVNLLNASGDLIEDLGQNLIKTDFLFPNLIKFNHDFDLIIGNPPWYTLRDIFSLQYQENVKKLAEELGIKPLPKNILNIEIASIFFYKAKQSLMNKNSKIFFVLPRGILTGSHASRFRNFDGFKNLIIWNFDDSIMKIFNIDFICLYGQKDSNLLYEERKLEIPEFTWRIKKQKKNHSKNNNFDLEIMKKDVLVPYSRYEKNDKIYVKKFIPMEKIEDLIPYGESEYKNLFHKGADLNPRNLIFVSTKDVDESRVLINPDERIFKRAKSPWNKIIFKDEIVQRQYIFKVVKSTELVSFNLFSHYSVFLPLDKKNLQFDYSSLDPNSKRFYNLINGYYLNNKKRTTQKASLMENLNHWQKLITPRQLSKIKVVYNNSGSILTSAVVEGEYLVTGDLSYLDTDNIDEAYYLSAILNSKLMNKQIRIKKSSRHIFKIPFEIPIPLYDENSQVHLDLAKLGKMGMDSARKIVFSFQKKTSYYSKLKLQKLIEKRIESIFSEIDVQVKLLFGL